MGNETKYGIVDLGCENEDHTAVRIHKDQEFATKDEAREWLKPYRIRGENFAFADLDNPPKFFCKTPAYDGQPKPENL